MAVQIGSARISEKGTISGRAGDGGREVAIENYYAASQGWYCLRPISDIDAQAIKTAMVQACANQCIGYSQTGSGYDGRSGVILALRQYGSLGGIKIMCNADCSSLVRACCIQAGFDAGNFTTANEVAKLTATGRFEPAFKVGNSSQLYDGDVLCTCTKGHTAVVINGRKRDDTKISVTYAVRLYGSTNWLPSVTDLEDYAGIEGKPINGIAIRVSRGSIKYRLHDGRGWSPWCVNNAPCTVIGKADAVQVYYYTPEDYAERHGYKCAKYRVSPIGSKVFYDWQLDDDKDATRGLDGYAGLLGKAFDKFEIIID